MKKLIIFDLDGVLFDSKKNMEISWKNVMKTYKIKKNLLNISSLLVCLLSDIKKFKN